MSKFLLEVVFSIVGLAPDGIAQDDLWTEVSMETGWRIDEGMAAYLAAEIAKSNHVFVETVLGPETTTTSRSQKQNGTGTKQKANTKRKKDAGGGEEEEEEEEQKKEEDETSGPPTTKALTRTSKIIYKADEHLKYTVVGWKEGDEPLTAQEVDILAIIARQKYEGMLVPDLRQPTGLTLPQVHYQVLRLVGRGLIYKLQGAATISYGNGTSTMAARLWLRRFVPDSFSLRQASHDLKQAQHLLEQIPGSTLMISDIAAILRWNASRVSKLVGTVQYLSTSRMTRASHAFCNIANSALSLPAEDGTGGDEDEEGGGAGAGGADDAEESSSANARAGAQELASFYSSPVRIVIAHIGSPFCSYTDYLTSSSTTTTAANGGAGTGGGGGGTVVTGTGMIVGEKPMGFREASHSHLRGEAVKEERLSPNDPYNRRTKYACFTLRPPEVERAILSAEPAAISDGFVVENTLAAVSGNDAAIFQQIRSNTIGSLSSLSSSTTSLVVGPVPDVLERYTNTASNGNTSNNVPTPLELAVSGDYLPEDDFPPEIASTASSSSSSFSTTTTLTAFGSTSSSSTTSGNTPAAGHQPADLYSPASASASEGIVLEFGSDDSVYRLLLGAGSTGLTNRHLRKHLGWRAKRCAVFQKTLVETGLCVNQIVLVHKSMTTVMYAGKDGGTSVRYPQLTESDFEDEEKVSGNADDEEEGVTSDASVGGGGATKTRKPIAGTALYTSLMRYPYSQASQKAMKKAAQNARQDFHMYGKTSSSSSSPMSTLRHDISDALVMGAAAYARFDGIGKASVGGVAPNPGLSEVLASMPTGWGSKSNGKKTNNNKSGITPAKGKGSAAAAAAAGGSSAASAAASIFSSMSATELVLSSLNSLLKPNFFHSASGGPALDGVTINSSADQRTQHLLHYLSHKGMSTLMGLKRYLGGIAGEIASVSYGIFLARTGNSSSSKNEGPPQIPELDRKSLHRILDRLQTQGLVENIDFQMNEFENENISVSLSAGSKITVVRSTSNKVIDNRSHPGVRALAAAVCDWHQRTEHVYEAETEGQNFVRNIAASLGILYIDGNYHPPATSGAKGAGAHSSSSSSAAAAGATIHTNGMEIDVSQHPLLEQSNTYLQGQDLQASAEAKNSASSSSSSTQHTIPLHPSYYLIMGHSASAQRKNGRLGISKRRRGLVAPRNAGGGGGSSSSTAEQQAGKVTPTYLGGSEVGNEFGEAFLPGGGEKEVHDAVAVQDENDDEEEDPGLLHLILPRPGHVDRLLTKNELWSIRDTEVVAPDITMPLTGTSLPLSTSTAAQTMAKRTLLIDLDDAAKKRKSDFHINEEEDKDCILGTVADVNLVQLTASKDCAGAFITALKHAKSTAGDAEDEEMDDGNGTLNIYGEYTPGMGGQYTGANGMTSSSMVASKVKAISRVGGSNKQKKQNGGTGAAAYGKKTTGAHARSLQYKRNANSNSKWNKKKKRRGGDSDEDEEEFETDDDDDDEDEIGDSETSLSSSDGAEKHWSSSDSEKNEDEDVAGNGMGNDDDDEEVIVLTTRVTSRGRIVKPTRQFNLLQNDRNRGGDDETDEVEGGGGEEKTNQRAKSASSAKRTTPAKSTVKATSSSAASKSRVGGKGGNKTALVALEDADITAGGEELDLDDDHNPDGSSSFSSSSSSSAVVRRIITDEKSYLPSAGVSKLWTNAQKQNFITYGTFSMSCYRERLLRGFVVPSRTDIEFMKADSEFAGIDLITLEGVPTFSESNIPGDASLLPVTPISFSCSFVREHDPTGKRRRRYVWTEEDDDILIRAFVQDRVEREAGLQGRYLKARLKYLRAYHVWKHLVEFANRFGTYDKTKKPKAHGSKLTLERVSDEAAAAVWALSEQPSTPVLSFSAPPTLAATAAAAATEDSATGSMMETSATPPPPPPDFVLDAAGSNAGLYQGPIIIRTELSNLDICVKCLLGSDTLVCCDKCPRTFCCPCLNIASPPEEDVWHCGECDSEIPQNVFEANQKLLDDLNKQAQAAAAEAAAAFALQQAEFAAAASSAKGKGTRGGGRGGRGGRGGGRGGRSSAASPLSPVDIAASAGGQEGDSAITMAGSSSTTNGNRMPAPIFQLVPLPAEYSAELRSTFNTRDASLIGPGGYWFGNDLKLPSPPVLSRPLTRWNRIALALGIDEETVTRRVRLMFSKAESRFITKTSNALEAARRRAKIYSYNSSNTHLYGLTPSTAVGAGAAAAASLLQLEGQIAAGVSDEEVDEDGKKTGNRVKNNNSNSSSYGAGVLVAGGVPTFIDPDELDMSYQSPTTSSSTSRASHLSGATTTTTIKNARPRVLEDGSTSLTPAPVTKTSLSNVDPLQAMRGFLHFSTRSGCTGVLETDFSSPSVLSSSLSISTPNTASGNNANRSEISLAWPGMSRVEVAVMTKILIVLLSYAGIPGGSLITLEEDRLAVLAGKTLLVECHASATALGLPLDTQALFEKLRGVGWAVKLNAYKVFQRSKTRLRAEEGIIDDDGEDDDADAEAAAKTPSSRFVSKKYGVLTSADFSARHELRVGFWNAFPFTQEGGLDERTISGINFWDMRLLGSGGSSGGVGSSSNNKGNVTFTSSSSSSARVELPEELEGGTIAAVATTSLCEPRSLLVDLDPEEWSDHNKMVEFIRAFQKERRNTTTTAHFQDQSALSGAAIAEEDKEEEEEEGVSRKRPRDESDGGSDSERHVSGAFVNPMNAIEERAIGGKNEDENEEQNDGGGASGAGKESNTSGMTNFNSVKGGLFSRSAHEHLDKIARTMALTSSFLSAAAASAVSNEWNEDGDGSVGTGTGGVPSVSFSNTSSNTADLGASMGISSLITRLANMRAAAVKVASGDAVDLEHVEENEQRGTAVNPVTSRGSVATSALPAAASSIDELTHAFMIRKRVPRPDHETKLRFDFYPHISSGPSTGGIVGGGDANDGAGAGAGDGSRANIQATKTTTEPAKTFSAVEKAKGSVRVLLPLIVAALEARKWRGYTLPHLVKAVLSMPENSVSTASTSHSNEQVEESKLYLRAVHSFVRNIAFRFVLAEASLPQKNAASNDDDDENNTTICVAAVYDADIFVLSKYATLMTLPAPTTPPQLSAASAESHSKHTNRGRLHIWSAVPSTTSISDPSSATVDSTVSLRDSSIGVHTDLLSLICRHILGLLMNYPSMNEHFILSNSPGAAPGDIRVLLRWLCHIGAISRQMRFLPSLTSTATTGGAAGGGSVQRPPQQHYVTGNSSSSSSGRHEGPARASLFAPDPLDANFVWSSSAGQIDLLTRGGILSSNESIDNVGIAIAIDGGGDGDFYPGRPGASDLKQQEQDPATRAFIASLDLYEASSSQRKSSGGGSGSELHCELHCLGRVTLEQVVAMWETSVSSSVLARSKNGDLRGATQVQDLDRGAEEEEDEDYVVLDLNEDEQKALEDERIKRHKTRKEKPQDSSSSSSSSSTQSGSHLLHLLRTLPTDPCPIPHLVTQYVPNPWCIQIFLRSLRAIRGSAINGANVSKM